MNILSSPKLDFASCFESLYPSSTSLSVKAIHIPFPPPPAEALIMTGYPISCAILRICYSPSTSPMNPGTILTLAFFAHFFDSILSPIACIAEPGGPINVTPLSASL